MRKRKLSKRDRDTIEGYRNGQLTHREVMKKMNVCSNSAYIFLATGQAQLHREENHYEEE